MELQEKCRAKIRPIPMDLQETESLTRYQAMLQQEQPEIAVLVNAAGFGFFGVFSEMDMERQLALCAQYHIRLDDLERHALKLLHAKTGAAIARDVFGVDDAVYWAIYWHTTGHADMTLLEKIIYLADYIEPSRDFPGVEDLRQAVHADLDGGLLKALNDSIQDMRQWGNPVHHNTLDARDYLLRGKHL